MRHAWLTFALAALMAAPAAAQAADFGHARLASSAGQPLRIIVPLTHLTVADLHALSAKPAPATAWAQAGLTPPVALDTLSVLVAPGPGADSARVLRVQSPEPFSGTLADLLLDVRTATGSERYQVSLVAPGPTLASGAGAASGAAGVPGGAAVGSAAAKHTRQQSRESIRVRTGDTMFAVARRNPVAGVSVYQLMLALQRANPQAFIHQNINLVRAGASLSVPSVADMLSISDAEARRQFVAQTAAFDRLRGRAAARTSIVQEGKARAGTVSKPGSKAAAGAKSSSHDQVRLSEGRSDHADARTSRGHALKDAESRVDQLQDNVQNLNQALQSQGQAAGNVVTTGATAIGSSIQKIAGAISQASHEAAAQAADRVAAGGPDGKGAAAGTTGAGDASPGAAAGAGDGVTAAGLAATAGPTSNASSTGPASVKSPSSAGGSDPLFNAAGDTAASQAKAHANAEKAERHATEQTQHRVNWLQDHLLGVMTGLLALIVFIIAWLLRRANAARDEADADPHVTEAMVQEKLQGIDLDLPPSDARTSSDT
ncbi:MAG TPA: FimV/HubP family polar landmark protein [Castellaniella sp.]|uniref:FimV/HubP family polar landmark protein n=1 Tax=Castellaniella sp. TaxID=1955812 RepID=UPI002F25B8C4